MDGNITINIVEPGTPPSPTPDPVVPNTGLFTSGTSGPEATIITAVSAVLVLTIVAIIITSLLYRKQKKAGKVTKLVHLVDSTKAVLKSNKRITTAIILLAILTSTGTFIALTKNAVNASENDEQATEDTSSSSLTVGVSSEELTIEVGDAPVFAVLPVEVTVEEATEAGYTLTTYADSTDLVSTIDSSKVIPMITLPEAGGELSPLTDNTYGLALGEEPTTKDEAVYTALSTDSSNPTILKAIDDYSSTPASDTTTIYYGFYITPDVPYGTYTSSDIYYNATINSSKVIFNGNGLYFNNNPEQTTNDVEYITEITEYTNKYSHTPNINDEGVAESALNYGIQTNEIVIIPGASTLHVAYTYGGGYQYGSPFGYGSFWQGPHSDYTPDNNYSSGIQNCGGGSITDGMYYSDNNTQFTVECDIPGDTATFGYWTSGGGPGSTATSYGYYVTVTGYDADGNIIYLPDNTQVGGEYKDPSQDLPYIFLGWNEDKDATIATYESKNDIELNLPLVKGETTELYAIWQHATKIHFDGNGSTSGEIPDKLLKPGEGASLCGYYYSRDGYVFNNWNTKPDGSGESYDQCYWYTAPTDQSIELNLYAQWTPVTTIVYDGNGGEGSGPTQTIRAGETSNIYGNWGYFSKDGYAFSYWNTKPDGSGETYYEGDQFTASDQSTTITLYAQWAATTITFSGNGATSGSMDQFNIPAGTTANLPQNTFTKDGYSFNGWNTVAEPTEQDPGEAYADQGTYIAPVSESQNITLYAQWEKMPVIGDLTYMQDFATLSEAGKTSVLNSMTEGAEYQLEDNRDQTMYYIAKLADGNIWMTQNLDLDIEAGRTYTSADTDLANSTIGTTWTPTASTSTTSSWTFSYTDPSSYDPGDLYWDGNVTTSGGTINDRTVIDPSATSGGTHYHIGNYYNWTAAVAMSDSSSYTRDKQDVNQSICPAGWRLPTYRGDKSYLNLKNAQGLTAGTSGNIQSVPTYFVYGGSWGGASGSVGASGFYWFSVVMSSSNSYYLNLNASGELRPQGNVYRDFGNSLRCVAR